MVCAFKYLSILYRTGQKERAVFTAASFCDWGWWDSCYFDRNIVPDLTLNHAARETRMDLLPRRFFFAPIIVNCEEKERSLSQPLCQCLADKGCSGITRFLKAVIWQREMRDTRQSERLVSWEHFSKKWWHSALLECSSCSRLSNIYTPDFSVTRKQKLHENDLLACESFSFYSLSLCTQPPEQLWMS